MSGIARALGIGRSTLYRKLREHGLEGGAGHGTAGEPGEPRLAAGR
jgi:transposase-like protein